MDKGSQNSLSDDLFRLGEQYARERNMGALDPNEQLPFGYFHPLRQTGQIDIPGDAREPRLV
jgi:hypothetical protein